MEFWGFVCVCAVFFMFFSIKELKSRLKYVEEKVRQLESGLRSKTFGSAPEEKMTPPAEERAEPTMPLYKTPPMPVTAKTPPASSVPLSSSRDIRHETKTAAVSKQSKTFSFEQQFGARLPVWIGGIALALSGFYLVKYSIERGLLTEEVRVMLGAIFGIALIAGARYIRDKKQNMADGTRIAQALCGAGIADLYATIFAATSLYHMLPPVMGFIGMAMVTAFAVVLSLRHGMPIALLGLLGGFITPALINSGHPSAITLFIYLYCIFAGLFAVIRQKNWWGLSLPALGACFIWVLLWVVGGNFHADDGIYLGLFILAVSGTVMTQTKQRDITQPTSAFSSPSVLGCLTVAGALSLMALVTVKSDFGMLEWGFYGLLGLGGIVMAHFKPSEYKYVPWAAMALNALMLVSWPEADIGLYALVLTSFALLYGASGIYLSLAKLNVLSWAGLSSATSLGFYLIAFIKLKPLALRYSAETATPHFLNDPYVWGGIALVLAALFAHLAIRAFGRNDIDAKLRDRLMTVFTLTTTAFISLGLTIELERDFLSVAFALQILATAWLSIKVDVPALRLAAKALFCVFFFLVLTQVMLLASVAVYSLFGVQWRFWHGTEIPFVDWPLFQLGFPAAAMGLSSWLFRQRKDGRFVEVLETASVMLGALMAYYLARKAFHVDENILFVKPGFFERGMMTNMFFVVGLACIYFGRDLQRRAIVMSGSVLFGMALFRVMWFDHITQNPLLNSTMQVGDLFLLNNLILPFGLPLVWLAVTEKPEFYPSFRFNRTFKGVLMLLLLFMFVTLNVRQLFHGTDLTSTGGGNAEVYAYSIAWLLMGVGLLILGTLRKDKGIRIASLVVTLVTIGKVFLYDAGELEGLYRVFSFMGLGLALIGLSWFYSRFVFKKDAA